MTDGKVFGLEDGESKSINGVITNDIYTMFEKDVHGYTMMYDDNNKNLVINDTLGVKKSFAGKALRIWQSGEDIRVIIYQDEMKIWCRYNDLGVYQSDKSIKYYRSVIASHNRDGGISVRGSLNVEDEASTKKISPDADDEEAPTESTSKID
ncbi:hypothetical protein HA466_0029530 [Hirschfeldia incana]|nr:hypothetical protein HA466_0029530 [Hirschfeldia incana]